MVPGKAPLQGSAVLALHHDLPLALLDDLIALIHQGHMEEHDALAGPFRFTLAGHFLLDPDGIADLDRTLEIPCHAEERDRGSLLDAEPALKARRDGEPCRAMQDPTAEYRGLGELLVRMDRI